MTDLRESVRAAMIAATPETAWDQPRQLSDYSEEQQAMLLAWSDAAIAAVMEASLAKVLDVRAAGAVNFAPNMTGSQFEAYDRAVLDIHKALSAFQKENSHAE